MESDMSDKETTEATAEPKTPSLHEGGTVPAGDVLAVIERGEVIVPVKARRPAVGFFTPNAEVIEGEWGGMPAYRCSACPFDSLEVEKTRAHLSIHGQTYTQGGRE